MPFVLLPFSIVVLLLLWSYHNLYRNYRAARQLGLPILITPINTNIQGAVWYLLGDCDGKLAAILRRLPFGLGNFANYSGTVFFWKYGFHLHAEYGSAYVIVNPNGLHVVVSDAATCQSIIVRRKEFLRAAPPAFDIFGKNVFTSNGTNWQRHRRITTTPFNEKINTLVWKEAFIQAGSMLQFWSAAGKEGLTCTAQDIGTLTLHVITATAFGKSYPFDGGLQILPKGHMISYRDSIKLILTNLVGAIVVTKFPIPEILLPSNWLKLKHSVVEFKQYMAEILAEERTSLSRDHTENLLGAFSRASEAAMQEKSREGLNDSEIFGNMFAYSVGGHDTASNILTYAITLVALHSQWQDWMRDEIRAVFGTGGKVQEWDYEKQYPRLKRCLAVMVNYLPCSKTNR
jgi:cytochrome P450